jgi:HEAT repeat protein
MPLFSSQPNIMKLKAKRNVDGLVKAMLDYVYMDDATRRAAAAALIELHDARAVELLTKRLLDEPLDPAIVAAHGTQGSFRESPETTQRLFAGYKIVRQRQAVIEVLGQLKQPQALPALIAELSSPLVALKQSAVEALGTLKDETAVLTLVTMLHREPKGHDLGEVGLRDAQTHLRDALVKALGKLGGVEAEAAIVAVGQDPTEDDSVAAFARVYSTNSQLRERLGTTE